MQVWKSKPETQYATHTHTHTHTNTVFESRQMEHVCIEQPNMLHQFFCCVCFCFIIIICYQKYIYISLDVIVARYIP